MTLSDELRNISPHIESFFARLTMERAAAEIERLRNALIEIRDDPTSDLEGIRAYSARILAGEDQ